MKFTVLLENKAISEEFEHNHGLSIYIEANGKKILSDMGSNNFFANNAEKLNINLSNVDLAVISHGHDDHGGGLEKFLDLNKTAKVYVRDRGFEEYNSKSGEEFRSIGLDPNFKIHPQLVSVPEYYEIDENTLLFSNVDTDLFFPKSNDTLYKKDGNDYSRDDFAHEQYLIIKEGNKNYLISGCAHKGILNILMAAEKLIEDKIDVVISGFHLHNPGLNKSEDEDVVRELAEELKKGKTRYYTCHCTGDESFGVLKDVLKDRVEYIKTGMIFEV